MKNQRLAIILGTVVAVSATAYLASWAQNASPAPATKPATNPATAPAVANVEFSRVKAVFDANCVSCHAENKVANDFPLTFKDESEAKARGKEDPTFWKSVANMISTKEMPPPNSKAMPTDAERKLVADFVATLATGPRTPEPGRFVLHRLNNREYANTIRDLFYLPDDWDASADFPPDERGDGFDNNSDTLTISPLLIEHYLASAEKTMNMAMNIDNKGNRASQTKLTAPQQGFKEDFADWQEKARLVVAVFLPRAWRRPVTKEEIDEVMKFGALALTHDGESISRASGLPMRAAIMSPQFLFRMETDWDHEGEGRIFQIDEFQLASRLSYFLWATMPDDELFLTAQDSKLREKLDRRSPTHEYLHTQYGVGYRFGAEPKASVAS